MGPSSLEERRSLMNVALGKEKADLVIAGGDLVNVYSGEILNAYSVAIRGERVALVGKNVSYTIGPETRVIDVTGKTLIPGLIDGHTHLASAPIYCVPYEFLRYATRGGTTTIITEVMEAPFAIGYSGLIEFLKALKEQPIKIFVTIPPLLTLSKEARQKAMDIKLLGNLLQHKEVVGMGESYWQAALQDENRFLELSSKALELGKTVEGHAAGARGEKFSAYIASGISSCHESIDPDEVLEKLRQGISVMIREGGIRKELAAISVIKDKKIDFRRLALVTDGIGPQELMQQGYMESVVQNAIDLGFDPIVAIQMASLNPAEHFHLDGFLGGIAPGRYADIVVIPNPRTIRAEYVISNGKLIAQQGELLITPKEISFSGGGFGDFREISPAELAIPAEGKRQTKVRVINQVTELVTRELLVELPVLDGEAKAQPDKDILKVALLSNGGKLFTGFIKGFGLRRGAMATSCAWDTCAIVCVGASEEDIAGAINRVIELEGGVVVYADGKVQAELALPIGGFMSRLPLKVIAGRVEEIKQKARELGCPFANPDLTLATISTPAIPFLRLCEDGLVDIRSGEIIDLIAG